MTTQNKLRNLSGRNVWSQSSRGWKNKLRMLASWGFLIALPEKPVPGFSPWLVEGHFHVMFFLCACLSPIPHLSFYKDTSISVQTRPHPENTESEDFNVCMEMGPNLNPEARHWDAHKQSQCSRGEGRRIRMSELSLAT